MVAFRFGGRLQLFFRIVSLFFFFLHTKLIVVVLLWRCRRCCCDCEARPQRRAQRAGSRLSMLSIAA